MSSILFAAGLTVLWVLAWGSASPANILSGLLIAIGLLVAVPDEWGWRGRTPIRPLAIARFVGYVLYQSVASNVSLTAQVLARRPDLRSGVIAVTIPPDSSDALVTLIANVMALTPGTIALEVDREPETTLYVHVLDLRDPEASREQVRHLAGLARAAFGGAAVDAGEERS